MYPSLFLLDLSYLYYLVINTSLLLVLYYCQLHFYQLWILRAFRRPFCLPIVGFFYSIQPFSTMEHISFLRKKYGRVFAYISFAKSVVVICEPVAVKRILSSSGIFSKDLDNLSLYSIILSNGSFLHKSHSRFDFRRYFTTINIRRYVEQLNYISLRTIEKHFICFKKSINIQCFFSLLGLRSFMIFVLGTSFEGNKEKERHICDMISKASRSIGITYSFSLPWWNINPHISKAKQIYSQLAKEVMKIVNERRASLDRSDLPNIDDCLSAMIASKTSETEIIDHLIAVHDTTSFFASYMCYLLATNTQVQETLREEILRVIGPSKPITVDDTTSLKYLKYTFQETLRLFTVIPYVSRSSTQEFVIKEIGLTIPKGVQVMLPFYLMNRDPDLWDRPEEFIPERFSDCSLNTFAYGQSLCIGRDLVHLHTTIAVCHLLRQFRLHPVKGFKPNILEGISLTTSNGIKVWMEKIEE